MTRFIAALPMYEWPETRGETDVEWAQLRSFLRDASIDAPELLVRRNADLPPVPGGIRDEDGMPIAPDPATLPPDELDFHALWLHPRLLLAQTCWGPMERGLEQHVTVVGQPSYDSMEGGQGPLYSSAILMRRIAGWAKNTEESRNVKRRSYQQTVTPPADGRPLIPLDLIRGRRFAYNSLDSMSGIIALTRDLEAVGESLDIFCERIETGGHRASIVAVAEGRADACAIDCRSWKMALAHEPRARDVEVVGWTGKRKGLPMITSKTTPLEVIAALKELLSPK